MGRDCQIKSSNSDISNAYNNNGPSVGTAVIHMVICRLDEYSKRVFVYRANALNARSPLLANQGLGASGSLV